MANEAPMDNSLKMTMPFQLTKKIHRSVPEYLQPEKPENSQKGKIIVITGGGSGIGAVSNDEACEAF